MDVPGVEVRSAGKKGRGLFAVSHINKGDILFEEVPLVSCQFAWNEDYKYQACEYCLRPLETAEENAKRLAGNPNVSLPYPEQCTVDKTKHSSCPSCGVKYCCVECQEYAWNKYHKTCCLQKLDRDNTHVLEILKETWKNMHYPPETANIMLLVRMVAMLQQSSAQDALLNTFQQFCHHTVNTQEDIYHKLLGIKYVQQVDMLRECFVASLNMELVPMWSTPSGFQSLLTLVGMNGQGIGSSAFSQWVNNVGKLPLSDAERSAVDCYIDQLYQEFDNAKKVMTMYAMTLKTLVKLQSVFQAVGEFLNNEGSGLYPLQSAINHSCCPNVEITFPYGDHHLAVRALTDLAAGEEVCSSYLDECVLERSRHSRQAVLRSNYLFTCDCSKCEAQCDDPDETSEDEDENEDLEEED